MDEIFKKVRDAKPIRHHDEIQRRLLKISEEHGEATQAFLSLTSPNNSKKKTWDDLREELVDELIIIVDVLLTHMPNEENLSEEELFEKTIKMVDKKIGKWERKYLR